MVEKAYRYKSVYKKTDIILVILYDIVILISCLPSTVVNSYQEWQRDLLGFGTGSGRSSNLPLFLRLLILLLLGIMVCGKNIYFKIIGSSCVIALLGWYLNTGIPDFTIERRLVSPFKEECYALIEMIPLFAIGFCILLGILNIVFRHNEEFSIAFTKTNWIVIIAIMLLCIFIFPYVLRPFLSMWL